MEDEAETGREEPGVPSTRAEVGDATLRRAPVAAPGPASGSPGSLPVVAVVVARAATVELADCLAGLAEQDHSDVAILVLDPSEFSGPFDKSSAPAPALRRSDAPDVANAEQTVNIAAEDHDTDGGARVDVLGVSMLVARSAPTAFVRRIDAAEVTDAGYCAIANLAIDVVDGAAFLLFVHDNVVLASDAVRLLVEEAVRSNAGVVGPKLVAADDHERLLAVGIGIDRTAQVVPLVGYRELDQQQHDGVREMLALPGPVLLVRADLFRELGGFDVELTRPRWSDARPPGPGVGEDVDLCWRARLLGARVVVVTAARASVTAQPPRPEIARADQRAAARNRVRALVALSSPLTLVRSLPLLLLQTLGAILVGVTRGPRARAVDALAAWGSLTAGLGSTLRHRRRVTRTRRADTRDLARLFLPAGSRLRQALRDEAASESEAVFDATGRTLAAFVRRGAMRWAAVSLVLTVCVLLYGSRRLLGDGLPILGQFSPLPPKDVVWEHAWSSWRPTGLGSTQPAPPALLLLWFAMSVLGGSAKLTQLVGVLGAIVIGLIGVARLVRAVIASTPMGQLGGDGSTRGPRPATTVAWTLSVVTYAAIPVPWYALRNGRWDGLVAFAAAPWLLRSLVGAVLDARAVESAANDRTTARQVSWLPPIARLAMGTAVVVALVPSMLGALVVLGVALALGVLISGDQAAARLVLIRTAASAVGAFALLLPWSTTLLRRDGGWVLSSGERAARSQSPWASLLRLELDRSPSLLGWGLVAAAVVPFVLLVGARALWTARLWTVALFPIAIVFLAGRGWLGVLASVLPPPEVLLAVAGCAMVVALSIGMATVLTGMRAQRFGWRQTVVVAAVTALVIGCVPALVRARGGRWGAPTRGVAEALAWMPSVVADGNFRVLWIGDPDALPIAGWRLGPQLSFATSRNGLPDVTTSWPGAPRGGTSVLKDALIRLQRNGTSRIGRTLGPMGIRYVVVVERPAVGRRRYVVSPTLTAGLAGQLDLRQRESPMTGLTIYENDLWIPTRARLSLLSAPSRASTEADGLVLDASRPAPVLADGPSPSRSAIAPLTPALALHVAESFDTRWSLRVGGQRIGPTRSLGWAQSYDTPAAGVSGGLGPGSLVHNRPIWITVATWLMGLLWLIAVLIAGRRTRVGAASAILDNGGTGGGADLTEDGLTISADPFAVDTFSDDRYDTDPFGAFAQERPGRLADELYDRWRARRPNKGTADRSRLRSPRDHAETDPRRRASRRLREQPGVDDPGPDEPDEPLDIAHSERR